MKFETDFDALYRDLSALTEGVPYVIANLANTAALLWERMEGLNWAGFYMLTDGALVLGPFQGKTACIRIPLGRGVCGTAAEQGRIQLVENVHDFPGHIACDSASNSKSWCRCIRTVHSGECWIWTALILDVLPRRIGRGWRNGPKNTDFFIRLHLPIDKVGKMWYAPYSNTRETPGNRDPANHRRFFPCKFTQTMRLLPK